MRRNMSLPPNRQNRATIVSNQPRSRPASIAPQADMKLSGRDPKAKGQVAKATIRLMEFLVSTEYPNAVSSSFLQSPNTKEVFCIFEHLVRQIEPDFRMDSRAMKVEEICVNTLKMLGYPHVLSKQYLATPCAPHAWPLVLSALDWLREELEAVDSLLYRYDEEQNMDEEPVGKLIHEISLKSFKARSHGSQLSATDLEEFQCKMSQILDCPSPMELRRLENRLTELGQHLSSGNDLDNQEDSLRTEITNEKTRREQLDKAKSNFESKLSEMQLSTNQHLTTLAELENQTANHESKLQMLQSKIQEQEEAGFGSLGREYHMLRERYDSRLKTKADIVRQIEQMELAYSRREGKIAPALDAYNRLVATVRRSEYEPVSSKCNLKVFTYHRGFDITKDLPQLINELTGCLQQFHMAVSSSEQSAAEIQQQTQNVQLATDNLEIPQLRSRISESKNELFKLDELLAEEDKVQSITEREYIQEHSDLSKQLDGLMKELNSETQLDSDANELLHREVHVNVTLKKGLNEFQRQMSVLLPTLESLFEAKDSAQKTWDSHMNQMREEIRTFSDRMGKKITLALEENEPIPAD